MHDISATNAIRAWLSNAELNGHPYIESLDRIVIYGDFPEVIDLVFATGGHRYCLIDPRFKLAASRVALQQMPFTEFESQFLDALKVEIVKNHLQIILDYKSDGHRPRTSFSSSMISFVVPHPKGDQWSRFVTEFFDIQAPHLVKTAYLS